MLQHHYNGTCIARLEKDERYPHTCKDKVKSNTLDNNTVTQPEHHPLCDYMISNCVEKCDCKTEWFKERMAKMEKKKQVIWSLSPSITSSLKA